MSVEQIEQAVLNLNVEERQRFLDWLYRHETELIGQSAPAIVEDWKRETRRRLSEIEDGSVTGIPGEEVAGRIRKIVGQ